MTAQISQASDNESQVMDTVLKPRQAIYGLAQPDQCYARHMPGAPPRASCC